MKRSILKILAAGAFAWWTTAAFAQSSYERGYNDGYSDNYSGSPNPTSEYGMGFQAGQDDADDDDDAQRRQFDRYERNLWKLQKQFNPDLPAPEPTYTGPPVSDDEDD